MMSKFISQFNPLQVRQSSFLKMIRISFLVSAGVLERHLSEGSGSSDEEDDDEYPSKTENTSRSSLSVPLSDPKGKKRTKKKDSSSVTRLKPTSNDPQSLIDYEEVQADLSQQSSLFETTASSRIWAPTAAEWNSALLFPPRENRTGDFEESEETGQCVE
jgi:hypothetical protein